ncbi:MAG: hypothetical protein K2G53_09975 [Muribaculaceae bacterium]|nr:hypothetical protein [Muribaculaceae bacterium]
MAQRQYSHNSEESEKEIERYLNKLTAEAGGLSLKYYNPIAPGYPDRILLFPDGEVIWVELKSKGQHPTRLQLHRISRLRNDYNQKVYVCDSRAKAEEIVRRRLNHEI